MDAKYKKLFSDAGIDPDDSEAVLGMILANPQAIANNFGVGQTCLLAAQLTADIASKQGSDKAQEIVKSAKEMPVYPTGAKF